MAVNLMGYLLMSSATVREGMERATRFQRVVYDSEWIVMLDSGSHTLIRFDFGSEDPLELAAQTEYKAAFALKLLDWVTASDFRASEARLRHPPTGEPSEYQRVFHCPVTFGNNHDELVISRWRFDEPSLYGNPEIARVHEEYARRHLDELEDRSVTGKVKKVLRSKLERGRCDLREIARELHMSPRTLQRRLAAESHSFTEIQDSLRREVCIENLEAPDSALGEIAYVAGFSDSSAFSRAVRRWTGQSPLDYRRSHGDSSTIV